MVAVKDKNRAKSKKKKEKKTVGKSTHSLLVFCGNVYNILFKASGNFGQNYFSRARARSGASYELLNSLSLSLGWAAYPALWRALRPGIAQFLESLLSAWLWPG